MKLLGPIAVCMFAASVSLAQAKNFKFETVAGLEGERLHFDVDANLLPHCVEGSGGVFTEFPNKQVNKIVFECTVPLFKVNDVAALKPFYANGLTVSKSNRNLNNEMPAPYVKQSVAVKQGSDFQTTASLTIPSLAKLYDKSTVYFKVHLDCDRALATNCNNPSLRARATNILNKQSGLFTLDIKKMYGAIGGPGTIDDSQINLYGSGLSRFCNGSNCADVQVNPGTPGPTGYANENQCVYTTCQLVWVYRGPTTPVKGGGYTAIENRPVVPPPIPYGCGGYTCP